MHRVERAWLLLILLAGCTAKTADAPDEPPDAGDVSGVIVTSSIEPIPGAWIQVDPVGLNGTTDAFGRFRFAGLAPGSYEILATAAGHAPNTAQVDVVAGQTARPRIVLAAQPLPVPAHETLEFQGYIPAGFGPAQGQAPPLEEQVGDCTCRFAIPTSSATVALVIEAVWTDSLQRPDEPARFRWQAHLENGTVEGNGSSPLHGVLEGDIQRGVLLDILPDELWPAYEQPFQLFVTRWDVEGPPQGWSRVRGDA